jgi:DHA3 family tetracycline resistance protein-like MFS transporter
MRKRLSPFTLYVILQFASSLFFSLIFTVNTVYHVTVVDLTPLQLVLVGTILESTVFLFEVPTGVLADVKSRRLSVIIGYVLMGVGFIVEGSVPRFFTVALAQLFWGLGYTFTSGATQAWIADEVGEERAGEAFLRGAQAGQAGGLIAIPLSVLLGSAVITLPIVLGGVLMVLLALFLAFTMTEEGFSPTPPEERTTWQMMLKTLQDAQRLIRRQPLLLTLLAIALFYGLYSEGLDRLWTAHLLENFTVSRLEGVDPVLWFGVIRAALALTSIGATELVRRRVRVERSAAVARLLLVDTLLLALALAGFGLVRNFGLAILLFVGVGTLRSIIGPLYSTWFNLRVDEPRVRATIFSVSSQVDAVGQIAGGPVVGAIGNRSIRAALVTSALILVPVPWLYGVALRRGREEHRVPEG